MSHKTFTNIRAALCFVAFLILAGCVTKLVPDDFQGQTATLRESYGNYRDGGWLNTDTAHFFVATRVDGKSIGNSLGDTAAGNSGRGFSMTPIPHERRVPIKTMKVELLGTTHHAADIGLIMNKNYSVRRTVTFTPQPGATYVVKGRLGDDGSSVWIESEDGTVVAR